MVVVVCVCVGGGGEGLDFIDSSLKILYILHLLWF